MLIRQKTVLGLLAHGNAQLSRTVFVKLIFLLRHETELRKDRTFYDFVPYKYGPFSFLLYWEWANLRQNGYVAAEEERVALNRKTASLIRSRIAELPSSVHRAIAMVVSRYGKLSHDSLVETVYSNYPWYATNSEVAQSESVASHRPQKAQLAVYTVGYEGKSVDAFFNILLRKGIDTIVDVRANPTSRKYGFSQKRFSEIANKLGLDYHHYATLGIPNSSRVSMTGYASYQRLLNHYQTEILPKVNGDINEVAQLMKERPSVLVCLEKDNRCCHRSRLAEAVSRDSHLKVVHLS